MRKSAFYYFAYGSNMNLAQMKQRCPSAKVLGIARLPGYKVEFYGYSTNWDGAQETVVPDSQSEVWGVLYDLQAFDWDALDGYQDARSDGLGQYFHYPVEVIDRAEGTIEAIIYKKNILNEVKLPSDEYLDFIVQGAKEQGLPVEYLRLLQTKQTKPASYDVPKKNKSKSSYLNVSCNTCDQ
ncbi:gamma-glutamylcyclotransferase family protein [Desulfosporosinus sp. OT]|uniref:gamma-glutamylcyclotransferase family protein n=1 Tax=Desulfosporosinus sp. OT TaxID=913865 RepID=UPI000223AF61|nr:gamma-glutamylcyclotransferase family protein [Desulfosporosinus sp. OT]EGW37582.1 AIG2-like family protein [Desulfosporosinus sp. OT]